MTTTHQLQRTEVERTAFDPEQQLALYRRSLRVVVVSQVFGGAGLAAGVTVGALLAQDMVGTAGLAGLPAALFTLGSALAALLIGRLSQRVGRRLGLAAGFGAGAAGAAGVVAAAVVDNVVLLFAALFVYGAGTATNLQARYAATDLAPNDRRATAVSTAMVATTLGAVVGPNSVNLTGQLASGLGLPALTGPFLLATAAYAVAGLVIWLFLRPDPYLVATALTSRSVDPPTAAVTVGRTGRGIANRTVLLAALLMVLTQVVMVAIMTMTPLHMNHHGHGLGQVGFVVGVHIGSMFLPSLLTGRLIDRVGRRPAVIASGLTMLAAGLVAAWAPGHSLAGLTVSLGLLGLGWNIGLIAGTALIVDATPVQTRARTQGTIDVLIALSGASGGALSGLVMAHSGYSTLALGGGLLALVLLPAVAWARRRPEECGR